MLGIRLSLAELFKDCRIGQKKDNVYVDGELAGSSEYLGEGVFRIHFDKPPPKAADTAADKQ